jgi:hypothetical protein
VIEPGFRPKYEKICVGNKREDAQDVFFEGMLLEDGLGTHAFQIIIQTLESALADRECHRSRSAVVWKIGLGTP